MFQYFYKAPIRTEAKKPSFETEILDVALGTYFVLGTAHWRYQSVEKVLISVINE